ncbi:MAG: DUF3572 domain-containing protein [Pseudomonadota bacterium]
MGFPIVAEIWPIMQRETAEILALSALEWLAGQDELLSVFQGATGITANDLRSRAADGEVLAAVLDFLLLDDKWVTDFAINSGQDPEAVYPARQALPGGDLPHWT